MLLPDIYNSLSRKRRRQLAGLLVLTVISAVLEVVSLGMIVPFIKLLTNPIEPGGFGSLTAVFGALSDPRQVITVIFVLAALLAGVTRIALLWSTTQTSFQIGNEIGYQLYRQSLLQPYSVHIARNTSEIIGGVLKVDTVVFVILGQLNLISSLIISIAISLTIFWIDPVIAIVAFAGFFLIYAGITLATKKKLQKNSAVISTAQNERIMTLQEGLGAIRDVIIDGSYSSYLSKFDQIDKFLRRAQGSNIITGQSPRYVVESLGIMLVVLISYYFSVHGNKGESIFPVLGALALGAQRLLPSLQLIYYGWSQQTGNQAVIQDVQLLLKQATGTVCVERIHVKPLPFASYIALENVSFCYGDTSAFSMQGINITIKKGQKVALIGETGSGKSTIADILLGLLQPTTGRLVVDGAVVDEDNVSNWQENIAHVPQSLFLLDASIAENIAFGVPADHIDMARVREAAQLAKIDHFIESIPSQYDTVVGERGVRLSGGQRQRIGIARALYRNAAVLVFDEATSALDTETESEVIECIQNLEKSITILMIAHRLSTIRNCDLVIRIQKGRIVAQGTYDAVLGQDEETMKAALAYQESTQC